MPWKKHLNDVTPYKPGKPIEEVKRELGLEDVIKLASNENPLGCSPGAIEAIKKAVPDINRYPDGGCHYLRQDLAAKLGLSPENFVFGNGSDEVIVLALHAAVDPGDEVIVADPTFAVYSIASKVKNAKVIKVPLKDFKYDLEAMAEAVTGRTKAVFIANPDNPTGSYANSGELDAFIEKMPKRVLVFLDEAYYEFARGGDYPESLKYIDREDRTVVVARTFSKAYGLAGLRIGYGVARPEIADFLNRVREPFNVNSLAQVAAKAALDDEDFVSRSRQLVDSEKEKIYKALKDLGVEYIPSRTNFILINTGRDSSRIFEHVLSKGVIIREMSPWGLKGFIRMNIGLPEENDRFLQVFKEALASIPSEK
ncbi:MAG: histidinol-phosphate transaminase [Candidatus Omnitrophica bacterium]|nr:histidinol-phosphate transaminase [Candidatus Omnitrophota bacterium]